jgi:hypothetical protein
VRAPGDLSQLVKRLRIDEPGDALANGQAPTVVLPLDARWSAELLGQRLAAP